MKQTTMIVLGALIAAAAGTSAGCQAGRHVAWQANGVPRHEDPGLPRDRYWFMYHPDARVYYQPYTALYYWCDSGVWYQGYEPPQELPFNKNRVKIVRLEHEDPVLHYQTVAAMHPPAKRIWERYQPPVAGDGRPLLVAGHSE